MRWSVTIPGQPPSVNKMYRASTGTIVRAGREVTVPTISKRSDVAKYQMDAMLLIRSAKPSRWKPEGFVRLRFRLYLAKDIDADNVIKAISDAIQHAVGINDKWFLPAIECKHVGLSISKARVEIDVEDITGNPCACELPEETDRQ